MDDADDDPSDCSTVCPLCAVGCRLESGDGTRANGVPGPTNPNGRLCRKGVGSLDVDADDRLTQPLLREGGALRPASWEEAYARVVDGIEDILDRHGPDALGFLGAPHCTNEENYLLQKLARVLGTNNVDNRARLCHAAATRALEARLGWPATTNGLSELVETDVIVVAGGNPAERQPVAFNSFVRPAVNDGATLVHIDPVGNATTRLADVHLAPRPGTDAVVFNLLSARLLREADSSENRRRRRSSGDHGVDWPFVDDRTRGFESFAASLRTIDPEGATSRADVDESEIDRVTELLAEADSAAAFVGTGVESGDGNTPDALLNLLLLTGNLGRRGTGLYVLRGLANEQGATDAGCVPDRLPGHRSVHDREARERIAAGWGVEPPSDPGLTAREMLASFGSEIRAAVAVGENPAVSKRDPEWTHRQLDALDLLVVLDIAPGETTHHADVVLPAAAGPEKRGTFTNLERRVQRSHPSATPPQGARSDFRILRDLGGRLAPASDAFAHPTVADAFDELAQVAPTYAELSFTELGTSGSQWPADVDSALYRDGFETRDGRAVFRTVQPTVEPDPDHGLHLVAGGRATGTLEGESGSDRVLRMHPGDARDRDIDPRDRVLVSNGEKTIVTAVALDDGVRRGTVYLPAPVADPLVRCGTPTVTVEASEPVGE